MKVVTKSSAGAFCKAACCSVGAGELLLVVYFLPYPVLLFFQICYILRCEKEAVRRSFFRAEAADRTKKAGK